MFPEVRHKKKSLREVLPQKSPGRTISKGKDRDDKPASPRSARRRGGWGYALFIIILLAVAGYVLSSLLARATVTIKPRQAALTLAENLTANKSQAVAGGLSYEVVTLPVAKASRPVPANGNKLVEEKATGQAVISNNFSSTSQLLAINTRLEAPNGKIYRLIKAVTVPGQKTVSGRKVAGTITADIVAGALGESYNSASELSFTIPGFKNSARYSGFTAKSKGAITGGASGQVKVVSEETKTKVSTELKQELRDQLLVSARAQIPPEFVMFDDGIIINFKDETNWSAGGGDEVNMTWSAEFRGLIFDRQKLANYVIGDKLSELTGLNLLIVNLDRLAFILNHKEQVDLTKDDQISFNLSGEAEVVAQVEAAALAARLVGVRKSEANQTLGQFKEIEQAEVVFRPPWSRRFPAKAIDIVIVDAIN